MELLSPAGNLETALAAFDGGADAVYCGLGRFNARERAENFTPDSLGKLLEYARCNGKKVYLTLNTLIWQNELGPLFEQLLDIDRFPPDALIVQDAGVAAIVRKYFPQLALHASTQMGMHNSAGIRAAGTLGFKRVILERQITLDELRLIAAASDVELEVFLHGSLCCSLSGRCLLSSAMYGESGNRGRCKQPCRRAFSQVGDPNSFLLSPADLAGSDLLPELKKVNIASLKIEGRLRSPDYIWKTARAYRILLDSPDDPEAVREAEKIFRTVPGRRKSTGFYFQQDWKKLIDRHASGTFGEHCATVTKAIRAGMTVKILSSLHLGDRLRVMPASGGEGESFTLAALENHRREKIIRGRSGETLFIPGRFHAAAGFEIRRIGENGFDFSRRAAALPGYRRELSVKLHCSAGQWQGEITGIPAVWSAETGFAPAEKRPFSPADAGQVFSEGVPEGFRTGSCDVRVDGSFFVPAAMLKELRRDFWNFFAPLLAKHDFFPEHPAKMDGFYSEAAAGKNLPPPAVGKCFHIPGFIPETELDIWQKKINDAYAAGQREFTAGHWHAFELLKNLPDAKIHLCYPFHISNSFAAGVAAGLGAVSGEISPECPAVPKKMLAAASIIPLRQLSVPPPLLVSRIPLAAGEWECGGKKFICRRENGLSSLHIYQTPEIAGEDQLQFLSGQTAE